MNSAEDKGPDGYLKGRNKWGYMAGWSDAALEAIINGTTQMLDMQNAQAKRSATFFLNQRRGKHKERSPARNRAMFLGTCKFNILGTLGRLVSLTHTINKTEDTDLHMIVKLRIAAEIAIAKAALRRALVIIDETNAEFNDAKAEAKASKKNPVNQHKENEK